MADSLFPAAHRARFQELLATGEIGAHNLHPEYLPVGPWSLWSEVSGDDAAARLQARFQAAVQNAARAAGAPARVNLLNWWIGRLAGKRKRSGLAGLVQRSIELCEVLESESAELPIRQASGIEGGLRRDRYEIDLDPRQRVYDHPHEALPDPKDEFAYWHGYVWEGLRKLIGRGGTLPDGEDTEPSLDGLIYDLRKRMPGETRQAFRDRVAKRTSDRYATMTLVFQAAGYDLGVLLANTLIDRGFRGNTAIQGYRKQSADLIEEMNAAWRQHANRVGLSWKKGDLGLTKVFEHVAADLWSLMNPQTATTATESDQPEPIASIPVERDACESPEEDGDQGTPGGIQCLKAPVFRYEYADDFPDEEQLAIENARIEANRALELKGIRSYDEHRATRVAWFWKVVTAAATAIGRAGSIRGWGAQRRRDELRGFGSMAAIAARIAGRDLQQFGKLLQSPDWHALDNHLFPASADERPTAKASLPRKGSAAEPVEQPIVNGSAPVAPKWATDLETPQGRKAAKERWKREWSTPERECTNEDLTEAAFGSRDRAFLNQWENGTTRLKDPAASHRIRALERVLRENAAPKWHARGKKS